MQHQKSEEDFLLIEKQVEGVDGSDEEQPRPVADLQPADACPAIKAEPVAVPTPGPTRPSQELREKSGGKALADEPAPPPTTTDSSSSCSTDYQPAVSNSLPPQLAAWLVLSNLLLLVASLAEGLVLVPGAPPWACQVAQAAYWLSRLVLPCVGLAVLTSCLPFRQAQGFQHLSERSVHMLVLISITLGSLISIIAFKTSHIVPQCGGGAAPGPGPCTTSPQVDHTGSIQADHSSWGPTGRVYPPSCLPAITLAAHHVDVAANVLTAAPGAGTGAHNQHVQQTASSQARAQLSTARDLLLEATGRCADAAPQQQAGVPEAMSRVPLQTTSISEDSRQAASRDTTDTASRDTTDTHVTPLSQADAAQLTLEQQLAGLLMSVSETETLIYSCLVKLGMCRAVTGAPSTQSMAPPPQRTSQHPVPGQQPEPDEGPQPEPDEQEHDDHGQLRDPSAAVSSEAAGSPSASQPAAHTAACLQSQVTEAQAMLKTKQHHLYAINATLSRCRKQCGHSQQHRHVCGKRHVSTPSTHQQPPPGRGSELGSQQGAGQEEGEQEPVQGLQHEPDAEAAHTAWAAIVSQAAAPLRGLVEALPSHSIAVDPDVLLRPLVHGMHQARSKVSKAAQSSYERLRQLRESALQQLGDVQGGGWVGGSLHGVREMASRAARDVQAFSAAKAHEAVAAVRQAKRMTRHTLDPARSALLQRLHRVWMA